MVTIKDDFNNKITGKLWNNGNILAHRNWHNDGVVDFSILNLDSGLTRFVGSNPQVISGDNFSYFYDASFDNTSTAAPAFQLEGSISVTNNSDFEFGIVDNKTSNGMFVFEQNADHIGVSDESHVNGDVIKVGDNAFDFPIGDGGFYRNAGISAPDSNNDTFIGEYFFESTNNQYPVNNLGENIELVDDAEYWVVERSSGNSQVFLTLSWNSQTTPDEIVENPIESMHIVRWYDASQLWINQGAIVDVNNQTVSALVENYGVFTLARVKEEAEDVVIHFPLFLTPNDDGYHDTWNVNKSKNFEIIKIQIFNRYGKLLKSLAPDSSGWDGTYKGKRLVGTDYWFVADYKDVRDNSVKQYRSHFALKY